MKWCKIVSIRMNMGNKDYMYLSLILINDDMAIAANCFTNIAFRRHMIVIVGFKSQVLQYE